MPDKPMDKITAPRSTIHEVIRTAILAAVEDGAIAVTLLVEEADNLADAIQDAVALAVAAQLAAYRERDEARRELEELQGEMRRHLALARDAYGECIETRGIEYLVARIEDAPRMAKMLRGDEAVPESKQESSP